MSLNIALNTAVSSLLLIEKQMTVTSSNIANADVAGYTRKSLDITTQTIGGAAGVVDGDVVAKTDAYLLRSIAAASSEAGYAATCADYFDVLDQSLGRISGSDSNGTSLASVLSDLESAVAQLGTTPESETLKAQVVADLDDMTAALRETSGAIQDLRTQADQEIETAVDTVNALLYEIDDINDQIIQAKAGGQSTADLEDARSTAVQQLSGYVDVSYFTGGDGTMKIYTGSGEALLDSAVHALSHTAASSLSSAATYADGDVDGIVVNGVDITGSIASGSIKALIDQRDTVLPAAQDELDTLAGALIDSFNAIYNQGAAVPGSDTLTGAATVAATDAFSAMGSVRIAVVDAEGDVDSYVDVDLSGLTTVSDVVDTLNGIAGVSASVDADGHLVMQSTDPDSSLAINETTSAVGTDGAGFSSYFGLSDLLTGTSAETIAVRADILDTPGLLATGSLDASVSLSAGDTAVGSGSATITDALSDALSGSRSFPASGALGATSRSFAEYAGAIVAGIAGDAADAASASESAGEMLSSLQNSYSGQYGVNLDEETAKLASLETAYSVSAQIVSAVQSMFDALMSAVRS